MKYETPRKEFAQEQPHKGSASARWYAGCKPDEQASKPAEGVWLKITKTGI